MKRLLIALLVGVFFFAGVDLGEARVPYSATVMAGKPFYFFNGNMWRAIREKEGEVGSVMFLNGLIEGLTEAYLLIKHDNVETMLDVRINSVADIATILDEFYENPSYRIIPIVFVITDYHPDNNNENADEFAEKFIRDNHMQYTEQSRKNLPIVDLSELEHIENKRSKKIIVK